MRRRSWACWRWRCQRTPSRLHPGQRPTPSSATETATFTIAGTSGIPADATAVAINVTALNASQQTHLTVWPAGQAKPEASSLNPSSSAPVPNLVTVKLGTGGAISVYNNSGTLDVFGDVVGYFRDHNHDDRYYTKTQVDAALATQASPVSSLVAGRSQDQATVSSLVSRIESLESAIGLNDASGSVLDLEESDQDNSFPTTLNHPGERRIVSAPGSLTTTVDSTVGASTVRGQLRAYVQCLYSPDGNIRFLDTSLAIRVNGTETSAQVFTGPGGITTFTWNTAVTGTGPFVIDLVLWSDVPSSGNYPNAQCLVDQGHLKTRLLR